MSVEEVLGGTAAGLAAFDLLQNALEEAGCPHTVRPTRTQVVFQRRRGFAWLWWPRRWLKTPGSDVALSVSLPRPDPSPRWKEIGHPTARRWMHHLEVTDPSAQVDDEVTGWPGEASQDV